MSVSQHICIQNNVAEQKTTTFMTVNFYQLCEKDYSARANTFFQIKLITPLVKYCE